MKKLLALIVILGYACATANHPQVLSTTLFRIDNEKVSSDEFLFEFRKNDADSTITKKQVDDYLDLYINFKLKVHEAKVRGYDTLKTFRDEFNKYKAQLDDSYLKAPDQTEDLIREAFERSRYELKVSHILIRVDPNALPADTLMAFKKIMDIRERWTKGESFDTLATTYSEDPSAKSNHGELGYFSILQMVYPFETMAYDTPVGQVSPPVRTSFGYHIIHVEDKRPSQGQVQVAHIMLRPRPGSDDDKIKIDSIYQALKSGEDWDQMCRKFLEDLSSASKGGLLAPFTWAQMSKIPAFANSAFALAQPGDLSAPFQTQYGWHILKLVKKIPLQSFSQVHDELGRRVKRDSRAQLGQTELLEKIKKQNKYSPRLASIKNSIIAPGLSFEKKKWLISDALLNDTTTLFLINNTKYARAQFFHYLKEIPRADSTHRFLEDQFAKFRDDQLINYEKEHLKDKYPEYVHLVSEYHDGILLFDMMEKEIWEKAASDSVRQKNFYQDHLDKYTKAAKYDAEIVNGDKPALDSIRHYVNRHFNGRKLTNEQKQTVVQQFKRLSSVPLEFEQGMFTQEQKPLLAGLLKQSRDTLIEYKNQWKYIRLFNKLDESIAPLNKVRGEVITGLQDEMEEEWIKRLKERYSVEINQKNVDHVYQELLPK